jgi:hypothetical protein
MSRQRSDLEIFESMDRKLDKIVGLLAIQGKEIDDQLRILFSLELESTVIAALVGVTPGYARTWKSRHTRKRTSSPNQ